MVKFMLTLTNIRLTNNSIVHEFIFEWTEEITQDEARQKGIAFVNNPPSWTRKDISHGIESIGEIRLQVLKAE